MNKLFITNSYRVNKFIKSHQNLCYYHHYHHEAYTLLRSSSNRISSVVSYNRNHRLLSTKQDRTTVLVDTTKTTSASIKSLSNNNNNRLRIIDNYNNKNNNKNNVYFNTADRNVYRDGMDIENVNYNFNGDYDYTDDNIYNSFDESSNRMNNMKRYSTKTFQDFVSSKRNNNNFINEDNYNDNDDNYNNNYNHIYNDNDNDNSNKVKIEMKPKSMINAFRVLNVIDAKKALDVLMTNTSRVWACDTEVADIDLKTQGNEHCRVIDDDSSSNGHNRGDGSNCSCDDRYCC